MRSRTLNELQAIRQPGTCRDFGVPVIIHATERERSLRDAATDAGKTLLVYEAGEALRFDEVSIRAGLRGIFGVMRALDMLPRERRPRRVEPMVARTSSWIRAPASGIMRTTAALGDRVDEGDELAVVSDPFGESAHAVRTHDPRGSRAAQRSSPPRRPRAARQTEPAHQQHGVLGGAQAAAGAGAAQEGGGAALL